MNQTCFLLSKLLFVVIDKRLGLFNFKYLENLKRSDTVDWLFSESPLGSLNEVEESPKSSAVSFICSIKISLPEYSAIASAASLLDSSKRGYIKSPTFIFSFTRKFPFSPYVERDLFDILVISSWFWISSETVAVISFDTEAIGNLLFGFFCKIISPVSKSPTK